MRSFAVKSFLAGIILIAAAQMAAAQTSCTCKPSPPGGKTECGQGEIAVCGVDDGVCVGRCITVEKGESHPLNVAAQLFTQIFQEKIWETDLQEHPEEAIKVIDTILENDGETQSELKFNKLKATICIGVTGIVREKLVRAKEKLK